MWLLVASKLFMEIVMNNLWLMFIGRIGFIFLSLLVLTACNGGSGSSDSSTNGVSTGTGGSTAGFTI
jgi:hypothetical protein